MNVLLILKKDEEEDLKVIVRLHTKTLRKKVSTLLEQNKRTEAIDLIFSKAMVERYLPPGVEPTIKPELTLVGDI